jgi:hypothetical protein
MKRLKRKNIGYKKERVVLSDILPYEVPPFFSNSSFYYFLVKNKITLVEIEPPFKKMEIRFIKEETRVLEKIVKIVFGLKKGDQLYQTTKYDYFKLSSLVTIPFKFRVAHNNNDFRELTVIHPLNQLSLVDFYHKYKYSIIYNTGISKFSLRRPAKISSLKYYKDSTNKKLNSKTSEIEIIETSNKEYTSLKSYFSYQKYNNINQFYESHDFQKSEKRFDSLLKFDISKCFDSIYSHTLPWALVNRKIIKDNVTSPSFKKTFGNKFDVLMQKMNYNETNGIIIGSEFSRIFAEIILQKIDVSVEEELVKRNLRYKVDYDIFRYVDDYFVFTSKDEVKDIILSTYKLKLQQYNLFFNDSKTKEIAKPIITNITIAKEGIRELIDKTMFLRFYDNSIKLQLGVKYYSAKDIITNYKKILSSTGTSYKDLQNYFLTIVFNKVKDLISHFEKAQEKLLNNIIKKQSLEDKLLLGLGSVDEVQKEINEIKEVIDTELSTIKTDYNQLYKNFKEIIELTFFIYTVLPKVTYSIKVSHILFRIIDFIKNQEKTKQSYLARTERQNHKELDFIAFDFDKKHILYKLVFDNISLIFKKKSASLYAEVETLYLLQISNELGTHYMLNENLLIKHFNISKDNGSINNSINYFSIISILSYIKRNEDYDCLRNYLKEIVIGKFKAYEKNDTENTLLLIDILTCPYIGKTDDEVIDFRRKILDEINFFDQGTSKINKNKIINEICDYSSNGFFKWINNDLGIELNTKRGHSVY